MVRELRAGDIVYLSGDLFALLDKAFWRIFEEKVVLPLPIDELTACVVGGGFVHRTEEGNYETDSLTPIPTTGSRYFRWIPDVIRELGVRAVVSKEGMGTNREILETCKSVGSVALAAFSFPPKLLPDTCVGIRDRAWEDLGGVEALTIYQVQDYGPLVVNMDTTGGCHALGVESQVAARAKEVYARRGLDPPSPS
jgi:fumarate hydratase subunit beta